MHKSKQTLGNYIKPDLAVSLLNSFKPEGGVYPGSKLGPKLVIIYTDNGTDLNQEWEYARSAEDTIDDFKLTSCLTLKDCHFGQGCVQTCQLHHNLHPAV